MGLFRPSRTRRGADPQLQWKMLAFVVGAAFGVAGMLSDNRWLIGIGIGVLGVGALLRFVRRSED